MRYGDLVQFEPIEDVVQLREADQKDKALHLVKTYAISDRMADRLANVVIPELQFESPRDNKGVLIVGNYGTGKSHLLSVISGIAEHADSLKEVEHAEVREAAQAIAGKFKVVRVEIGGVTQSLRDILLDELETALKAWGTPYTFPPASQLASNKDPIIAAVHGFREKYPDHGILLVVDELLDYLRTREERALILDLGFLRELGEVAALTPFRFLAGLQETLFDSPRFSFVAQQLRRVRDRFEQLRIAREDIAFVVSHRLLCKTDEQTARITNHLRRFTHLYHRMAERLDEFASLFPVHPAYLDTFELVFVAEKREVLRTLSRAMRGLLDEQVPGDQPGLLSYDHYWDVLRENASMRSIPEVATVIEKSNVLEGRIRNAYTRPHLLPMALRIVHALSVHRLTTADILVPLGVTAEELRDDLCLFVQAPEPTAEFLLDQVQVALGQIMRTVSGQYITFNDANGQYYLDVKKDIDFEAKIRERGDFKEDSDLNPYFYRALSRALDLSDSAVYVTGHRIWFYELPWMEHKVTRPGYLFLGPPDERSTAQPPRDFYVYVLPAYPDHEWYDEERSDEVVFHLTNLDQSFRDALCMYAGASALAGESATHRDVYAEKAEVYYGKLLDWLRQNVSKHLYVTYQGVTKPVAAVLSEVRSTASQSMEELMRLVAAHLLSPEFEERYPAYPAFARLDQPVSEEARPTDAMEAIRFLAGRGRTKLAMAILEGLELVDADGNVRPYDSLYARRYLDLLQDKAEGQVVNRGELIEQMAGGLQPIEKGLFFGLEPEWIAVVLLALVYNGDIVLNLDGREELNASNIERAAMKAIADLTDFRFFKRPRTLPLSLWISIFEGLGLSAGLMRDENTREEAVKELQRAVRDEVETAATVEGRVQQGLSLWNTPIFTDRYKIEVQAGVVVGTDLPSVHLSVVDLLPHVRAYKRFLDELARFNTVGKLRNLRLTVSEIGEALGERKVVARAQQLLEFVDQIQPLTAYLAEARANLRDDDPWSQRADTVRQSLLDELRHLGKGDETRGSAAMLRDLTELKAAYIAAYAELHRRMVLGPGGDDRRKELYKDPRLQALDTLSAIELLDAEQLAAWKEVFTALPVCRGFHEGAIEDTPTCPQCGFRPAQYWGRAPAEEVLSRSDKQVDTLLADWRQVLRTNLTSDTAQRSLEAMTPAERRPIEAFLEQKDDDTSIPAGFTQAATQALRGIVAVTLPVDNLLKALKAGGLPCAVDELRRRFNQFVDKAMRGHDARNTRLTLDE